MKKTSFLIAFILSTTGIFLASLPILFAEELTMSSYYPSPTGHYQDLIVAGNLGVSGNVGITGTLTTVNMNVTQVLAPDDLDMSGDLSVGGISALTGTVNATNGVTISTTNANAFALALTGRARLGSLGVGTSAPVTGLTVAGPTTLAQTTIYKGALINSDTWPALNVIGGLNITDNSPDASLGVQGTSTFNGQAIFHSAASFNGNVAISTSEGTALAVHGTGDPAQPVLWITRIGGLGLEVTGSTGILGSLLVNNGVTINTTDPVNLTVTKGIRAASLGIGSTVPSAGLTIDNGNLQIANGGWINSTGETGKGFNFDNYGRTGLNVAAGAATLDIRSTWPPDMILLQVNAPVALSAANATARINGTMGVTGITAFSGKVKAYNGILVGDAETTTPVCAPAIYGTMSYRCTNTNPTTCTLKTCTPCDDVTGNCAGKGSGDMWLTLMTSRGACAGSCGIGPNTTVPTIN